MPVSRHPNRRAFVGNALATLGALTLSEARAGLFGSLFDTRPPYPVKSSGLAFGRQMGGVQPIFWLDDQRVLMPAQEPRPRKGPDGKDVPGWSHLGVYIWDVQHNSYIRYGDLVPFVWLLQYDRGNIAYSVEQTDLMHGWDIFMIGKIGEEKRVLIQRGNNQVPHPELDSSRGPHIDARWDTVQRNVVTLFAALRPEHGAIVVATGAGHAINIETQNDRVKLYRPGQAQPIELPILAKEWDYKAKFSYSDYLGQYVLIPHTWRGDDLRTSQDNSWPADLPIPVYLISPEGKVETIELPPRSPFPAAAFPTRVGLVWVSNEGRHSSRDAGGWVIKDGKVTQLFDQLVDGAGVSPDGCTLAYAVNDFNPKTLETVQAMTLCTPQKQN